MPLVLPDGTAIDTVVLPSGNRRVFIRNTEERGPPTPEPRTGPVQWYVCYTSVHPATVAGAPKDTVWVDVSASPDAYFGAIAEMWAEGESFALLEHDVVARPDCVQAFEDCPEPWCTYGYADICHPECMESWANALGCTRFRKELIDAVPDALSRIPAEGRDWHNLCDWIGQALREAGFTHHWHAPAVEHHHMGRHG